MDARTREFVRERAGHCCEYCMLTEAQSPVAKLQIEHIVPKKHGGTHELTNLALACIDCNLHKGPNLTGIDPDTGLVVQLFNPRTQQWSQHFAREGCLVVGTTSVGRTTTRVLEINSEERVRVRLSSK